MSSRILIAPLDWGLGHATRCIPVIRQLLQQNNENPKNKITIFIAAEKQIESLLKEEFLDVATGSYPVQFISLRGYRIRYFSHLPAWVSIMLQLPSVLTLAIWEHMKLKKIIADHQIDTVISDNRFGLSNRHIRSIYLTHQLRIPCPPLLRIFEPLLSRLHRMIIHRFDECWIPDYETENNLSGKLSHGVGLPSNCRYIGPLSRFSTDSRDPDHFTYDLCVLISGPEPSRSRFEKLITHQLKSFPGKYIVFRGKPGEQEIIAGFVSHLNANELESILRRSKLVISRAGYSTIMDLHVLNKQAVLIPTPGQPEQEYLAEYLNGKNQFHSVKEKDLQITLYQ